MHIDLAAEVKRAVKDALAEYGPMKNAFGQFAVGLRPTIWG